MVDAADGTVLLRTLNVTLRLKGFSKSGRDSDLNTVCTFTPCVPDVISPMVENIVPLPAAPVLPPISTLKPATVFANLNPHNSFTFDDIYSRSYAGNIIASVFPTDNNDGGEVSDAYSNFETSSVDKNSPDLTSNPDYDILKYTMAAILHVETKQAATKPGAAYTELDLASEEENAVYQERLNALLDEFADRFYEEDFSPSNMAPVDIKVKEEFKDKIFYRPKRRKSPKDQKVIDNNGRRILDRGWGTT